MGLLALMAVAIVGCGGGEGNAEAVPTKGEFLKKVDQVCRERLEEKDAVLKAALEQLPPSEASNLSPETLEGIGESIVQPMQKLTKELTALPAPPQDEAAVEEIVRKLKVGLKRAEANPGQLIQTNPFQEAGEAMGAYGFQACAF